MNLKQSNPHLKSTAVRKSGLRVSAASSSAVEGIRAPFAKGEWEQSPPGYQGVYCALEEARRFDFAITRSKVLVSGP
jgi:hypothetical protein